MALQAMHSLYWPGDGLVNGAPAPALTQYPAWQHVAITALSLLLCCAPGGVHLATVPLFGLRLSKRWKQRLVFYWRHWVPLRVRLTVRLFSLLWGPDWSKACHVVQTVATTPRMREPNVWGPIGNYMGQQPGVGENLHRHMLAAQLWGPEEPYHRHERNVLLELAYYALKAL